MTLAQIAALETVDLAAMSTGQITSMTSAQVQALTTAEILALTTAQVASMTTSQIQVLSPSQITSLKSSQIASLSTNQARSLTNTELGSFRTAQIVGLNSAQIASLSTLQLSAFSSDQIAALTPTQLAGLTTIQKAALGPHTMTGTSGNDTLTGAAWAESVNAGAGNDTMVGFVGPDTIDGGQGTDTITLSATSTDLNNATNDQIINVEVISAAGASAAVIINLANQTDGFTIVGGSGADSFLGSRVGPDVFDYTKATGSLVANYDTITEVKAADTFKVGHLIAGVEPLTATATGTGNLSTDLSIALKAATFIANSAAVVSVTGTGAGTFLVINDGTAGFQAATDAVVKLINASTLTGKNFST
jgi:ALTTAQ repeat/RTX calcium-binding nonapeptide repeat (4 copies)